MSGRKKKRPRHITIAKEVTAKRKIRDSVFTALFGQKKYLLQLYQAIHPEDKKAVEEDLTYLTLQNVLVNDLYNDIGFQVGERLIVLVECQVQWSMNLIIRILLYLAKTYQEYINTHQLDIYQSKTLHIPKPELYMVYVGDRKTRPENIMFSRDFFGETGGTDLDIKVHILYGENEKDIIGQYVIFTRVFEEQRKLYQYTRKAVEETIRICKDRNVLREFLDSRRKEVVDIMTVLFDEEQILKNHIHAREQEVREETEQRMREEAALQVEQVREETARQVREETEKQIEEKGIKALIKAYKMSHGTVRDVIEAVISGFGLSEQESRSRVQKYWNTV